ncbi:fluoride efflux transporter FluC [Planococcus salinus]|uniref:Fluoride-specific ion channel FluC n=1 Tax=Planococcus salinus TaxID=1848460 RepID=A0A3M8P4I0_9BACL|nr:CrcB family protein [Planococcus salinus]RNF38532.1 CrcB family protein [Planococcus salinus]
MMAVALGGFVGAVCRYFCYLLAESRSRHPKAATWFVNSLGSFLLGAFVASGLLSLFWVTGFLGAFTTFSTMALDAVKDLEEGKWKSALVYLAANLISGIVLFSLAYTVAG